MPSWRGEHAVLPFVVLMAMVPSSARAAEPARIVELEWIAPPGCPTAEEVVARVEELVGAQPIDRRTVSARGRVTRSAGTRQPRFRLELVIVGNEANKRSVSGDDCSHLIDAAALILALDIDPDVLMRREEQGTSAQPTAPADEGAQLPPLSLAPTPPDPPSPSSFKARPLPELRSRRRAVQLEGGARGVFDSGSLPRPTLGVGVALSVMRGPLMLEIQGTSYGERFSVVGPRRGSGGAYVTLSTVSGHACWRVFALRVDWRGCAGGELGRLSTRGVSLALAETSSGLWSAVSAMVSARVLPRATVSPTAGVALAHPVGSPPVFIEGFGTVYEPSLLTLRCFLGLDVLFF